ncbi:MAG: hypothetical protein J6S56_00600 [Bacteroidales bacterium]|nr:hypothetical protein [Bacteroidales bacterium]
MSLFQRFRTAGTCDQSLTGISVSLKLLFVLVDDEKESLLIKKERPRYADLM